MVRGAPDGILKFGNEGYLGQGVTAYAITGVIAGGAVGTADLPTPLANTENIFIHITASVNDDEAIHIIELRRLSDGYIMFYMDIINNLSVSTPTINFTAGEIPRVSFTNNHVAAKVFYAVVYWVNRSTL